MTDDIDMHRIAVMESIVWGQDWSRLGDGLIARVSAAPEEIAVMVAEADGAELAVAYLHVDASDDSAPILRRLGFHSVTTTTPYVWSPPQQP
ncbi:hypothetical protein [Nonomuraea mesophila]|uniref:hypothetical protein n=1 Tax=Nonomuraea mesophila TaxID=2530382 RepID=UPI001FE37CAF|nr:hypothetical protein [Nonomuraea mesophila]